VPFVVLALTWTCVVPQSVTAVLQEPTRPLKVLIAQKHASAALQARTPPPTAPTARQRVYLVVLALTWMYRARQSVTAVLQEPTRLLKVLITHKHASAALQVRTHLWMVPVALPLVFFASQIHIQMRQALHSALAALRASANL